MVTGERPGHGQSIKSKAKYDKGTQLSIETRLSGFSFCFKKDYPFSWLSLLLISKKGRYAVLEAQSRRFGVSSILRMKYFPHSRYSFKKSVYKTAGIEGTIVSNVN